jgi:hypothetical protein
VIASRLNAQLKISRNFFLVSNITLKLFKNEFNCGKNGKISDDKYTTDSKRGHVNPPKNYPPKKKFELEFIRHFKMTHLI